ncbi:MAG: DUF6670 family protein [Rhodococcus sp. (in: high G+C Gram-positive bacteria)]|uniref:DUF6670 family protein n=1 Tax=Rhodococcus sp. TaxID=1831 RepID=UPI002ADA9C04|nr:DUF6670 family protein [Rhodococcus sp. (in: high G+C Gram-positive bacteria)]
MLESLTRRAVPATTRVLARYLVPAIDTAATSTDPLVGSWAPKPHTDSRLWAWTHLGIFIPELPAPHRYLNTMTLIGATGSVIFDDDCVAAADARRTATVMSSTAVEDQHHYRGYDSLADCEFASDGSSLRWSDELDIRCEHPVFAVTARYKTFSADLEVTATDRVSWFVRNPAYHHYSVLATVTGTITDAKGTTDIDALCTVEYARCVSPQALRHTPLPAHLKVPIDFFTYQIVNLSDRSQLLLTDVRACGEQMVLTASIRSLDDPITKVFTNTRMSVIEWDVPRVDARGQQMWMPKQLQWHVNNDRGEPVLTIQATIDAPWRKGHGVGFASAYTYTGRWGDEALAGSGYIEWVDCEPH